MKGAKMERGQKVGSGGSANGSQDNLNNPLLLTQPVVATSLSSVPEAELVEQANATRVPETNARRNYWLECVLPLVILMCCGGTVLWFENRYKPRDNRHADNDFGFNYDPTSRSDFINGVRLCDSGVPHLVLAGQKMMDTAFVHSLMVLDQLRADLNATHYNTLKTFFSEFSSESGACKVQVAQQIDQYNRQYNRDWRLAVGLYLFTPADGCADTKMCAAWSDDQLAAINHAVVTWPVITSVWVGNEDRSDLARVLSYAKRLQLLKQQRNLGFAVATPQVPDTVSYILQAGEALTQDLLNNLDVIGSNIYPYWAGATIKNAATDFKNTFAALHKKAAQQKISVVVSEQGWVSAGERGSNANMFDYLKWVFSGDQASFGVKSTFIFQAFDKFLSSKDPLNPENNWGICSHDSGVVVNGELYQSCLFDASGNENTKQLSPANKVLKMTTDFQDDVRVLACDQPEGKGLCGPVNGFSGQSDMKKGQDLYFHSLNLGNASSILTLWNLNQPPPARPDGWCHLDTATLEQQGQLEVCWDSTHVYNRCDTSLGKCT